MAGNPVWQLRLHPLSSLTACEMSILSVLRERAGFRPNGLAFTFTDYDRDWGTAESLTWSQPVSAHTERCE